MAEDGSSKLDSLSKEELVKLVKKYIILQKTLKNKNEDLSNKLKLAEESSKIAIPTEIKEEESANNISTQQINDLKLKVDELNKEKNNLLNENSSLKESIENLKNEAEVLKKSLKESENFKLNLEPQLENARREIELNKSMLLMLNNEIKLISSEKNQLEKKLLSNTRRITTPSVIIEEDEEDLEEENNNGKMILNIENINDKNELIDDLIKTNNDKDVDFLLQNNISNKSTDGILILNKQIEDMSFYIDELKSELEAEREKNSELTNEINKYNERENLPENIIKDRYEDLLTDNQRLNKELNESLFLIRELEQKQQENKQDSHFLEQNDEKFETKFLNYLNIIKEELIIKENFEEINQILNIENGSKLKPLIDDLIEKQKFILNKRDSNLKELSDKVNTYESQIEKLIKDFKIENENLENSLKAQKNEFDSYKSHIEAKLKSTQIDLDNEKEKSRKFEKFEKEAAKNKMLGLEIADYERTIKQLNVQIITKDKEINDLKLDISSTNQKLVKLKEEFEKLERNKEEIDEKNTKLKQLLVKAKKDVSDAKAHEAQHLSADAQMKAQLEAHNLEIENYKLQAADLAYERQKLQEKLQSLNENNQRTIQLLETRIKNLEGSLKEAEAKSVDLKNDFDNYKLKVQHAFKKQKEQNETSTTALNQHESQKFVDEIEQLKLVISKLNEELSESNEKAKFIEKEFDQVQEEYSKCLDRNTKLLAEIKDKENEWKLKSQELKRESTMKSEEAIELIRELKNQNETQSTNFKEKIKQLNHQNNQSIDLLQSQLETSKIEIDKLNKYIDELKTSLSSSSSNSRPLSPNNSSYQQQSSNFSDTSRNNSNNFILSQHSIGPLSFDQELNENKFENEKKNNKSIEELLSESPSITQSTNYDSKMLLSQIDQLKIDLNKSKLQLEHLNELLNESELNNARLTEQINLLKEEIRRLERNQEREKSISNMEYLKNVVLKFLSFSSSHEREQLLPVLSTMLKLNKDEELAILNGAKGNSSNNYENQTGWATYLPKWPSK